MYSSETVMINNAVTIMVVDDDKVDKMAIKRSFRSLNITNPIVEASNGIEALDYLRGENGRERLAQPVVVLLDLNMPRMGGLEFLEQVRADPLLQPTLIFVLTTSSAEEDRIHAYAKNIAGYVLKQRPGQSFVDAISVLEQYWRIIEYPIMTDDAAAALTAP